MLREKRPRVTSRISWTTLALGLVVGGILITSCNRPTASDATKSDAFIPVTGGPVLRAEPNPIPKGNPNGTTTITWDTGAADVGEVYMMDGEKEKLFATGAKGSQTATGIKPGSTEFMLYTKGDHKLLAGVKVTMSTP